MLLGLCTMASWAINSVFSTAPAREHMVIHTGNVRRCNHLQQRPLASTKEEIQIALECTLSCWKKHNLDNLYLPSHVLGHPKLMETMPKDKRGGHEVTVKLFLTEAPKAEYIAQALEEVCTALGIDDVDLILLKFVREYGSGISPEYLKLWRAMEAEQARGRAKALATVDLDETELEQLRGLGDVMPTTNQVDFKSNLSEEEQDALVSYSEAKGIHLTSHDDTEGALTGETLCGLLRKYGFTNSGDWEPTWCARYTVLDSTRSVIQSLGYTVGARRR